MKDAELLVLKVLKSKDAKQKYIMYHLRTHWADRAMATILILIN